jgi:hypothetical protein
LLSASSAALVRECLFALVRIGTPSAVEAIRKARPNMGVELQGVADGLLAPVVPNP